jgi:hypothetical protein
MVQLTRLGESRLFAMMRRRKRRLYRTALCRWCFVRLGQFAETAGGRLNSKIMPISILLMLYARALGRSLRSSLRPSWGIAPAARHGAASPAGVANLLPPRPRSTLTALGDRQAKIAPTASSKKGGRVQNNTQPTNLSWGATSPVARR